ncbi:MAG: TPM domain-containing protein [Chlorobi bacterium]|nr:TPM domain-containing protein [Chlorobiota bacterium]
MTTKLKYFLVPLIFILALSVTKAQDIPPRPQPPRLVNDLADILSPQQEQSLENKLVRFNDTTSNQITIVTVNSLEGYDPAMFAYEIGEKWKVGQKKFDNGVVVLVKPKRGNSDRGRTYIAVGYGLEPAIPDAISKRIVENEMIPEFKKGNYYAGLNKATNVLMQLASGEISAKGYAKKTRSKGNYTFIPFLVILIIIILMKIFGNRSSGMGRRGGGGLWTGLWLGSMMGGSHSGSWGGFSGGGSGFGGGGGFGGFGGGSFGGGGAGGSW